MQAVQKSRVMNQLSRVRSMLVKTSGDNHKLLKQIESNLLNMLNGARNELGGFRKDPRR